MFGSLAAAYARLKGIETKVFDPGLPGAASRAAAGLFKRQWFGPKLQEHFAPGLMVLDRLYGARSITLNCDDAGVEELLFVPPSAILEPTPAPERVSAVGDGWLEADGRRHEGWVYVAAGTWSGNFLPGLEVHGRSGAALVFEGERPGRFRRLSRSRQAVAFVRDPGTTFFHDGTAEIDYKTEHDHQTLANARSLGLIEAPVQTIRGARPYVRGGPLFHRVGARTWLATGGRKVGIIVGASFARRLVEEELRGLFSNR